MPQSVSLALLVMRDEYVMKMERGRCISQRSCCGYNQKQSQKNDIWKHAVTKQREPNRQVMNFYRQPMKAAGESPARRATMKKLLIRAMTMLAMIGVALLLLGLAFAPKMVWP